jgi:hypothetical protein
MALYIDQPYFSVHSLAALERGDFSIIRANIINCPVKFEIANRNFPADLFKFEYHTEKKDLTPVILNSSNPASAYLLIEPQQITQSLMSIWREYANHTPSKPSNPRLRKQAHPCPPAEANKNLRVSPLRSKDHP